MMLKSSGTVSGCFGHARGRRSLSIPQASAAAAAQPLLFPATLPISRSGAAPVDFGPLPLSYRTQTTDPVFRPEAGSDQQYAPGPPQLLSRHLTVNPVHGLASWASAQATRLDLVFAATMDRLPMLHWAAAAATAGLTFLGLHPLSLLRRGLPGVAADWLESRVGEWVLPLVAAAALAGGLVAALWQLRNWVAVHSAVVSGFDSAVRAAGAAWTSPLPSAPSETSAVDAASAGLPRATTSAPAPAAVPASPAGPFLSLVPASLRRAFEADWKGTDRTWLLLIMAGRLSTLLIAASSLMYGGGGAVNAFTAVCFASSLLPLALPHIRQLLTATAAAAATAPSGVPGGVTGLAAMALLSDASFLLAFAPAAPTAVRAAAAVALAAGSGLTAAAAAASPRLAAAAATPGDVATFHVIVRLPTSGTVIDTSWGHRPLTAVVGTQRDDADATRAAAAPGTSSSPEADRDPQARFRPLQAKLAAAVLPGMYLGERRTVVLASGADADGDVGLPFRNPGLVWWQPLEDLQRKVGSRQRELRAGDVFWYPGGSLVSELGARRLSTTAAGTTVAAGAAAGLPGADSWGPVEVVAVSEGWVHLDGNAGLKAGQAEVELQLVALDKKQQQQQ